MSRKTYQLEDLTAEHQKIAADIVAATLIAIPSFLRRKMLTYIDEVGFILSPAKLSICVQIITLVEQLSVETDELHRVVQAMGEKEEHDKNCECNDTNPGKMFAELVMDALTNRHKKQNEEDSAELN